MKKEELIRYTKLLLGKWVLWLFVVLDIIGALASFLIPNFNLPMNIYGLVAIVGFFWAGYQVYDETTKLYNEKLQTISKELNINTLIKEPKLVLSLIEGQGYTFAFLDEKRNPNSLPSAELNIYVRIENIGCNMDILIIRTRWETEYKLPFGISLGSAFSSKGELEYPIHLASDNFLECNLRMKMSPNGFHSTAQFASRLKDFQETGYAHITKIGLEAVDSTGKRKDFTLDASISFRPLTNLYIAYWQNTQQNEFIRLAGGITQKAE